MGVTGLWRLIEPAGRPVHLDSLRGQILAVDISIWLHQVVKGFQDAKGAAIANSHLLGLFQRLCKLLYYGIRPIFVFDGCFPPLKKQTIINRQKKKAQARNSADKVQRDLMEAIAKHIAVKNSLTPSTSLINKSPTKKTITNDEDLFKLPPLETATAESTSTSEEEFEEEKDMKPKCQVDLHTYDVNSEHFKNLSAREKYDLLTELKETRKASSWGRIHELPTQSNEFSDYQMKRLLKRRQVQVSLEEAEKEVGGQSLSLNELELLLNEEGIDTKIDSLPTRQIASNENVHIILVKDVKEAMKEAVKKEAEKQRKEKEISDVEIVRDGTLGEEFNEDLDAAIKLSLETSNVETLSSSDDDDDLNTAIALSLENNERNISSATSTIDVSNSIDDDLETAIKLSLECDENIKQSDVITSSNNVDLSSSDDEATVVKKQNSSNIAKSYMLEYSGLSEFEINRILNNEMNSNKPKTTSNGNGSKFIKGLIDSINKENHQQLIQKDDKIDIISSDMKSAESSKPSNDNNNEHDIECMSTSSDDTFEEVDEPNEKTRNEELNDDIFADVFEDKSKFDVLDNNILMHIQNKTEKSDTEVFSDLTCEDKSKPSEDNIEIMDGREKRINVEEEIEAAERKTDDQPKRVEVEEELEEDKQKTDPSKKVKTLGDLKRLVYSNSAEKKSADSVEDQEITREAIVTIEKDLENRVDVLEKEQNKLDRAGRNITEEMTKDAQELLRLFGIPYIVAPTEAEAQCAFLESIDLTDGTITDDSDIWLFGGRTVYRNFFDQQKHVLKFVSDNISQIFKLQKEDLILLALLVGSDYTLGVNGVGPVTALEILAAFPRSKDEIKPPYNSLVKGLVKFREWWSSRQNFTYSTLRSKLKNIALTEEFPNVKVIEAYLCPEIETSKEAFTWGTPDVATLRDFAKDKFGWDREKTDNILNPVLKRLDIKVNQQSILKFFQSEPKIDAKIDKMSKRVQKAIEHLGSENTEEAACGTSSEGNIPKPEKKKTERKRKGKKTDDPAKKKPHIASDDIEGSKELSAKEIQFKNVDLKFNTRTNKSENIPQREYDRSVLLENKLKAIEVFRKSKMGPGFVKKKKRTVAELKVDAELSESSDSD